MENTLTIYNIDTNMALFPLDITQFFAIYVKPSDFDVKSNEMDWRHFEEDFNARIGEYPICLLEHLRKALIQKMLLLRLILSVEQLDSKGFMMLGTRYHLVNEMILVKKYPPEPILLLPAEVDADWSCAICLDNEHEHVVFYKKCHTFHEKCLLEWLKNHKTCPICRS